MVWAWLGGALEAVGTDRGCAGVAAGRVNDQRAGRGSSADTVSAIQARSSTGPRGRRRSDGG